MKKNEDIKESLKDYDNDEINESIELKSFSHFEEIIFDVYQQKTNRSHLIMDVMLKKEGHHHQTTSNVYSIINRLPLLSLVLPFTNQTFAKEKNFRWKMILSRQFTYCRICPELKILLSICLSHLS